MTNYKPRENVEILGHTVDFGSIQNPILKKIIETRIIAEFMFGYSDHRHTDDGNKEDIGNTEKELQETKEYWGYRATDNARERLKRQGEYNEYSVHSEHSEHNDASNYPDAYKDGDTA